MMKKLKAAVLAFGRAIAALPMTIALEYEMARQNQQLEHVRQSLERALADCEREALKGESTYTFWED